MKQLSFFKLPLISILFYFLFDMMFIFKNVVILEFKLIENNLESYISFIFTFIHYIVRDGWLTSAKTNYLLLFIVISFSLYRAKVHIITTKNIFLLGVNSYFVYASSRWLMPILYKFYFNAYLWLIFDPYVIMAISSIICYFLIKVLSDKFDKDQQQFELTTENNPRIHFIIFLVFLIFTLFILTSFFINLILYYKELMPFYLYDNLLSLFDHTMLNTINALIAAFVMVRRSTQPITVLKFRQIFKITIVSITLGLMFTIVFISESSKQYYYRHASIHRYR